MTYESRSTRKIGIRIRRLRNNREMTLKKLADITSISIGHLSDIERGESKLSGEKIAVIAEALVCTTDYLLTGIQTKSEVSVKVEFPKALSDAALSLGISYAQTLQLLEGRQSLIARRSRTFEDDDWQMEDWVAFYKRVEKYL